MTYARLLPRAGGKFSLVVKESKTALGFGMFLSGAAHTDVRAWLGTLGEHLFWGFSSLRAAYCHIQLKENLNIASVSMFLRRLAKASSRKKRRSSDREFAAVWSGHRAHRPRITNPVRWQQ